MKKSIGVIILAAVFVLGIVLGDLFGAYIPVKSLSKKEKVVSDGGANEQAPVKAEPQTPAEIEHGGDEIDKKAQEIIDAMSLDEKIYQMMFVTPESITGVGTCVAAGEQTRAAIEKYPVGGIIYFSKNVQSREQLTKMIENTKSYSKIPLFIGVDEEGGSVRRLGQYASFEMTQVGDMADLGREGNSAKVYEAAKAIGSEIRAIGFNVDFAPVADVLVNSENTVVKRRSFGKDTDLVSKMSLAFVNGLQDNNVSACLKHFPGHGGTAGDTHDGYSENANSKEQVLKNETSAFKRGIDGGCDFVMTGHISIPALTGSQIPCSLSDKVIKDILKNEYGFEGVVITDALDMGAISQNYSAADAAVRAIGAGNDMILMPSDVDAAFDAIKANVGSKITEEQINESVTRILKVKLRRGIIEM